MIVRDVTDTRTAEEELRKLPARLLDAQDQERRRIARELHDTTAQNISAIHMNLVRLAQEEVSPAATRILADCQALCDASLREIRTLSYCSILRCSTKSASCQLCVGSSADCKREAAFASLWKLHPQWSACRRRSNEISFLSFKRRF